MPLVITQALQILFVLMVIVLVYRFFGNLLKPTGQVDVLFYSFLVGVGVFVISSWVAQLTLGTSLIPSILCLFVALVFHRPMQTKDWRGILE